MKSKMFGKEAGEVVMKRVVEIVTGDAKGATQEKIAKKSGRGV